ncbi:hypothetical protein [Yoonia sp. 2307UL14-13]|uniref:hypothetical protein n=1 Tax=Yoonia sp. 2307UL14-13 TaxID=3126506 RepID=UPI00309542E8
MTRKRNASLVFVLALAASSLWTTSALTEVIYEEIDDFEVRTFPFVMAHPYQITIPNTDFGHMIRCDIYDGEGDLLPNVTHWRMDPKTNSNLTTFSSQLDNSGNGETRFYFAHKVPDAKFRCFHLRLERSE